MGLKVSAATAAKLVKRHERNVRAWIELGKLRAERQGNQFDIDTDDLAQVMLKGVPITIDRELLAQLQAQEGRTPGGLLARLEHVENENRVMRLEIDALKRRLARLDGQETLIPTSYTSSITSASDWSHTSADPLPTQRQRSQVNQIGIGKRYASGIAVRHGANSYKSALDWEWGSALDTEEDALIFIERYLVGHPRAGRWQAICESPECHCRRR